MLISAFLGDGKQAGIDVYVAGVILVVFLLWRSLGMKLIYPDKNLSLVFSLPIIWSALSVFWSDGIAATVFTSLRVIIGYLSLIIGATFVYYRGLTSLLKSLVALVSIMIIVSWVLIPLPFLSSLLPQMNLLYANYGHSHLADLLILFLPPVLFFFWQSEHHSRFPNPATCPAKLERSGKPWRSGVVLSLWFLGLVASFARAAWLLLALGALGATIFMRRRLSHRVKFFSLLLTSCFLLLFIGITLFGSQLKPASDVSWLGRQIVKVKPLADGRLEYWRHAISAIKERPFFGSGAGTFDLQSKRLQSQPDSYTWFAHNSFLQTWVEVGIVGVLLWGVLFFILIKKLYPALNGRQPNRALRISISVGLLLLAAYSLLDFVFDYLVTWCLTWLLLGVLLGGKPSPRLPLLAKFSLITVSAFYLISLAFLLNLPFISNYSFYPPSGVGQSEDKLTPVVPARLRSALLYYKSDAQILHWAGLQLERSGNSAQALAYYQKAIAWDPKNLSYRQKHLTSLISTGRTSGVGPALYEYLSLASPPFAKSGLRQIDFANANLAAIGVLDKIPPGLETISKLLYAQGEQKLTTSPLLTQKFWVAARDLSPQWSYFHLELASLLKWRFNDKKSALSQLGVCQEFISPREHCREFTSDNLPPPGSFHVEIQAIPD